MRCSGGIVIASLPVTELRNTTAAPCQKLPFMPKTLRSTVDGNCSLPAVMLMLNTAIEPLPPCSDVASAAASVPTVGASNTITLTDTGSPYFEIAVMSMSSSIYGGSVPGQCPVPKTSSGILPMFAESDMHMDDACEYVHGEYASPLKADRDPHDEPHPFQKV